MAYAPVEPRKGVQRILTLDREADAILMALAPGPNIRGHYVSRLILQEAARLEERQRLQKALDTVKL